MGWNFKYPNRINKLVEDGLSCAAAIILTVYGLTKRTQFNLYRSDLSVSEMTSSQLMWAFYGSSKPYAITIGLIQILSAVLIIFRRTRIIGCLLATSILINIILQDIFYGVSFHALAVAVQLQIIVAIVMYMQRQKILEGLSIILDGDKGFMSNRLHYGWLFSGLVGLAIIALVFAIASIFL